MRSGTFYEAAVVFSARFALPWLLTCVSVFCLNLPVLVRWFVLGCLFSAFFGFVAVVFYVSMSWIR